MKKVLYIIFGLIATLTFTACGCEKNTNAKESTTPTVSTAAPMPDETVETPELTIEKNTENAQTSNSKSPAISENKDVISEGSAPKVFVRTYMEDLSYHLEGCANLAGKDCMEISWDVVQTIGLWQCPVCNPPRYEGYQNAE